MARYPKNWPGCRYYDGRLFEITGHIEPHCVFADPADESERKHREAVRPDLPGWIFSYLDLEPLTPTAEAMMAIARSR